MRRDFAQARKIARMLAATSIHKINSAGAAARLQRHIEECDILRDPS
jgi:hypothetical protein